MSAHPPGVVVIAGGEFLRWGAFTFSLLRTQAQAPVGTTFHLEQSVSICENLNTCIRAMRSDHEWIWIQADDHLFPDGNELLRLLDRQVPIVAPLMMRRSPPFVPVAFRSYEAGEGYMPFAWDELPESGMIEVVAAGSGGMLVRREVLDAIGDPWFIYSEGEGLHEDLTFCRRASEHGFPIYLDVEVRIGHRGTFTAWPTFSDGRWGVGLNMGPSLGNQTTPTIVVHPNKEEQQ